MSESIESADQFQDNPSGWAKRWAAEIKASEKMLEKFHKASDRVVDRYLDDRENDTFPATDVRLNMYWRNVKTLKNTLFANVPRVDVSRSYEDQNDDVARVASQIIQRLLDYDIENSSAEYETVLRQVTEDRLIPGLGVARLYYEYESETQEYDEIVAEDGTVLAEGYEEEVILDECSTCEYFYWGDVLWAWTRDWESVRWIAFRNYMTRDEVKERFGEKYLSQLTFEQQTADLEKSDGQDQKELWDKAPIWEIWCKESMSVYWWSKGCRSILDSKEDPLGLKQFFPCPRWWMANTTTKLMVPKADFLMAQDLYNEIDTLHTRISILTEAVKVVGVYDQSSDGIKRMLEEGVENELIPVDNWAMFAEKGGIQGQIDWLPVEAVVNAIINLRQLREDNILLLEKITGMSDIISGVGTHPREGVGTQQMKAEFGSVDIQTLQEELATFATELLAIKAEIICKHCSPDTIMAMANVQFMLPQDQQYVPQALELLKDWESAALRIRVRSESMARIDYSRLKQERSEYLMAMAQFMQSAAPLISIDKSVTPTLLEMLKWGLAGFRGSDEIEGVLDAAITQATKSLSQPQEQQDPEAAKAAAEQQAELVKIREKAQADLQIIQAKTMSELQKIQAKSAAETQKEEAQAFFATQQKEVETMFDAMLAEVEATIGIQQKRAESAIQTSSESSR